MVLFILFKWIFLGGGGFLFLLNPPPSELYWSAHKWFSVLMQDLNGLHVDKLFYTFNLLNNQSQIPKVNVGIHTSVKHKLHDKNHENGAIQNYT